MNTSVLEGNVTAMYFFKLKTKIFKIHFVFVLIWFGLVSSLSQKEKLLSATLYKIMFWHSADTPEGCSEGFPMTTEQRSPNTTYPASDRNFKLH